MHAANKQHKLSGLANSPLMIGILSAGWLAVIISIFLILVKLSSQDVARQFELDSQHIHDRLIQRLQINATVLDGFAAHLAVHADDGEKFSYAHTSQYVRDVISHYPNVYMLEAVQRVPVSRIPAFEQEMRKHGFPQFQVKSFDYGKDRQWLNISPTQEFSYPIMFIEPLPDEIIPILGIDVYSVPHFKAALIASVETGRVSMSEPFELIEGGNAYAIFKAESNQDKNHDLPGKVALMIVRTADLLRGLDKGGYELQVHYEKIQQFPETENNSANYLSLGSWIFPDLHKTSPVNVAGQSLSLVIKKTSGWDSVNLFILIPLLLFVSVISLILYYLFNLLRSESTSRMISEHALHESEVRYQEVVKQQSELVCRWRPDGDILFVNDAYCRFVNQTRENLYRSTYRSFLQPDELAKLDSILKNISSEYPDVRYESCYFNENNEPHWFEWIIHGEFDSQGNIASYQSIGSEITTRILAEQKIRKSEQELTTILNNVQDTYYRTDIEGRLVYISKSAEKLLGLPTSEIMGKKLSDFYVDPQGREKFLKQMRESNGVVSDYEASLRRVDGSVVWVSTNAHLLVNEKGEVTGVEGTTRDVTERVNADKQMRKLSSALEQTADSVLITDRDGIIEYVNQAFEMNTGYSADDAIGKTPGIMKSGRHDNEFYRQLWNTISGGEVFRGVVINQKKDGTLYYEEKTITPLFDDEGVITHYISTGKDISERMQNQERLQYLAHHDVLTCLPNRMLFTDRLEHAISRNRDASMLLAVLFLDLDRFKKINDTLGHNAGDHALAAMATRLKSVVREGDTVARLGGDEFAILLEDIHAAEHASLVAGNILNALEVPLIIDERELFISTSIGISLYPMDGNDAQTLIKNSDIAMYRAKEQGRNNYQFYSSEMSYKALERLNFETGLRYALERDEFILHYQPQLQDDGQIIGLEALLRWNHPKHGIVAPADIIPILEDTGLIAPVGEWVINAACKQLGEWQRRGCSDLKVAINISSRQFNDAGFIDKLKRILDASGVKPEYVELEITESVLIAHTERTLAMLNDLKLLGVSLAIDDFGTGYSSLSYLKRFPIQTLKIDRSFVRDITSDPDDAAIVNAIIALGKSLNLNIVAEGVETLEQVEFLRQQKCVTYQGYYFSKPVEAAEIEKVMQKNCKFNRQAL